MFVVVVAKSCLLQLQTANWNKGTKCKKWASRKHHQRSHVSKHTSRSHQTFKLADV